MHSNQVFSFMMVFALTGAIGAPAFSYAGDDPKGAAAMNARVQEIEKDRRASAARIEELRKTRDQKNPVPYDREITALRNHLLELQTEQQELTHKLKAGERKYNKVVRDETKVEELRAEVAELEAILPTAKKYDVSVIKEKIQFRKDEIERLEKRVGRKEKAYNRKLGDSMPSRKPDETPPAPVPTRKTLTDAEKMKLDECFAKGEALKKKVVSHFTKGQDLLRKNSPVTEELPIRESFERDIQSAYKEMQDSGMSRIWKVEATSYGSRVGLSKSRTADQLSKSRSSNSINEFFSTLAVDNGLLDLKTKEFEGVSQVPDSIEVGPKWTPGDYAAREKRATNASEIKKAAEAMLASGDPTPVRAVGGTPEENLQKTIENLTRCCSANMATLKYQPYQYTELTIYGAKFTPSSEACVTKADQVANTVSAKKDEAPTGYGASGLEREPAIPAEAAPAN